MTAIKKIHLSLFLYWGCLCNRPCERQWENLTLGGSKALFEPPVQKNPLNLSIFHKWLNNACLTSNLIIASFQSSKILNHPHCCFLLSFMVNIGPNETDITMHINPRFNAHGDENAVVCNSYQGGSWCDEVRQGGFPFKQGEEFKVGLSIETPLTAVKIRLVMLRVLHGKRVQFHLISWFVEGSDHLLSMFWCPPPHTHTSLSSRLSSPSLWRSSRCFYPTAPPSSSQTAWAQTSTPTSTWTATPASPALKSSESPEIFSQEALELIFRESWCGFGFFF